MKHKEIIWNLNQMEVWIIATDAQRGDHIEQKPNGSRMQKKAEKKIKRTEKKNVGAGFLVLFGA